MPIHRRKRTRFWVLGGIALVLLAATGLWLSGNLPIASPLTQATAADSTAVDGEVRADAGQDGQDEAEEVPVPVELAKVERRPIASFYRAASVIEADRLVDLVCKVTGRIQAINVEEGDWVRKGEVLAELENGRERIQLRQAELKLQEQSRQLERYEAMLAEQLVSRQEYDDVRIRHDLAAADRDLARITLEETIIRAPFAGQITERMIVLGQQVSPAVLLLTLGDFQPLRVRVHLPENIARKVSAGQRVLVSPEALSEPLEATVERISPVVDPATSTVRLTLLLADQEAGALCGGFVKVRITTDAHHDAMSIPKLSLVEEGGLRSVFVAEADSVRKVEINTGLYDETHIEVLDGLAAGSYIVTLGQGGLRTGSKIEAINASEVGWEVESSEDSQLPAEPKTEVALTPES